MKKSKQALMLLLMLMFTGISSAQTLDEIMAGYNKAIGSHKFAAINTFKQTGSVSTGMGELNFVKYSKRPNVIRTEIDAMGQQIVQLFDGTFSYSNNPFQGIIEMQKGSDEQTVNAKIQSDFDPPLLNYKEKGSKLELMGKEKVDSADTYKLKLVTKDGFESIYYLNAATYLPARLTYRNSLNGVENNNDLRYLTYTNMEGIMIPDNVKIMMDNNPMGKDLSIKISGMELNPVLDDAIFTAPAGR